MIYILQFVLNAIQATDIQTSQINLANMACEKIKNFIQKYSDEGFVKFNEAYKKDANLHVSYIQYSFYDPSEHLKNILSTYKEYFNVNDQRHTLFVFEHTCVEDLGVANIKNCHNVYYGSLSNKKFYIIRDLTDLDLEETQKNIKSMCKTRLYELDLYFFDNFDCEINIHYLSALVKKANSHANKLCSFNSFKQM